MALKNDGVTVTAEVVEVTVSRDGEPQGEQVRLPDGRATDVDISERPSNDGLKVGSKLQVAVQRDDISNDRPADTPAPDLVWYADALAPLGISVTSAVVAFIAAWMARRPGRSDCQT